MQSFSETSKEKLTCTESKWGKCHWAQTEFAASNVFVNYDVWCRVMSYFPLDLSEFISIKVDIRETSRSKTPS